MSDFAFNAHSGWRYAVLFIALMTIVYALLGMVRKHTVDKSGMALMRMFTIFLDIQFALGIVTLFTRPFYSALIGHLVMMIAAIAVAHLGLVRLKKGAPESRSYGLMLASSLIPLALIVAGIVAIQRPII